MPADPRLDTIKFECPCGKSLAAELWHAGKKTKCPKCGAMLTVPVPPTKPVDLPPEKPVDPPELKQLRNINRHLGMIFNVLCLILLVLVLILVRSSGSFRVEGTLGVYPERTTSALDR
jgi:hypothetical protein